MVLDFSASAVALVASVLLLVTLIVDVLVSCLASGSSFDADFVISIFGEGGGASAFCFGFSTGAFFSNLLAGFGENLFAAGEVEASFCLNIAIFSARVVGPTAPPFADRDDNRGDSSFGDPFCCC